MTPALLSWSGGKDAAWALQTLRAAGEHDVIALLTTLTRGYDRISMQGIRRDVLHAQARALDLPVIEAWIEPGCDNAAYEASLASALGAARTHWPALHHVAFGDLFLADIRTWREALCARHGWTPLFPLFGANTAVLARQMQAAGLQAVLSCVDTTQLDARFAGRRFDAALLDDLPPGVDPCGERGEFHTCVQALPGFQQPLQLLQGETVLREGRFAYTDWRLVEPG